MRSLVGKLIAIACSSILCTGAALGQFAGPAISSPSSRASAPASAMNVPSREVRIRPGDVIAIATYGVPELTTTAMTSMANPGSTAGSNIEGIKVGAQGEIVLPYLGVVKVAGMTAAEVAVDLEKKLKDAGILVDPQVSVQVVASPAQVITVVGEVQKSAPVPAFGELRLLDVIAACGGFTPLASHTITVRRPGDPNPITVLLGTDPKDTDEANIPLMPGDTVIVPKVGSVFVVGQVKNPEAIPLSSNYPVTVMRAIAMSGGVNFGAALSKVMIIRRESGNQHVEIVVNLGKVMHGKEKDVALMSDDVLVVPRNGFKSGMAAGGGIAAANSIYGLGYWVH